MTESSEVHQGRSASRLRFSLRLILLLFLLAPPLAWLGWRLPFEEESVISEEPRWRTRNGVVEAPDGRTQLIRPYLILGPPRTGPDLGPHVDAQLRRKGFYRREVRTVRRAGLSEVERHGETRVYNKAGRLVLSEHWRGGVLDGPYRHWDEEGTLRVKGQFVAGKQHGSWSQWERDGAPAREYFFENGEPVGLWRRYYKGKLQLEKTYVDGTLRHQRQVNLRSCINVVEFDELGKQSLFQRLSREDPPVETARLEYREGVRHGKAIVRHPTGVVAMRAQWRAGSPHGEWTWRNLQGDVERTVLFKDGLVAAVDGRAVADARSRLRTAANDPMGQRMLETLNEDTTTRFSNTSLSECLAFMGDVNNVPFQMDRRAFTEREVPTLSGSLEYIPLGAALTILLTQQDLTYTYQFEQLIVTSSEQLSSWERPGFLEASEAPLFQVALGAITYIEHRDAPLDEIAKHFSNLHGITIRLSSDLQADPPKVTMSARGLQLRSALGLILTQYDLDSSFEGEELLLTRRSGKPQNGAASVSERSEEDEL